MGIYISGVKGLPEQVQQNKKDIKTIQDEIEGIDFDSIRELEEQVEENTQDINNLEASIGVQNQAINSLNDDVDALESKTQLITYNSDYGMTAFRNSIEVADDVYASNVRVQGDGSIVNTSQSGMHFKEGANDDVLTIANNDGATPHYFHLNADGSVDVDGQPIGKTYYRHVICFAYNSFYYNFEVISTKSTAYTQAELRAYLSTWNDGTFLSKSFQLIGIDTGYHSTTSILIVNPNNYYFYLGTGAQPITLTSLSNYIDIVAEA